MRRIGFSTGALAYGDFKKALELMFDSTANAIELSALRRHELDALVTTIDNIDLSRYRYISVHAPSNFDSNDEPRIIKLLEKFANKNWPIVLHPDAIKVFKRWRVFGSLLLIENMDTRKSTGKSCKELEHIFEELPDARFCFDIAHARQYDPTMTEARLMLKKFKSMLKQVHISGFNEHLNRHTYISLNAAKDYNSIASLIPNESSVILESVVESSDVEMEINSAIASLNQWVSGYLDGKRKKAEKKNCQSFNWGIGNTSWDDWYAVRVHDISEEEIFDDKLVDYLRKHMHAEMPENKQFAGRLPLEGLFSEKILREKKRRGTL